MPLSAGYWGSIPFIVSEQISFEMSEAYPYAEIPRIGTTPKLHMIENALQEVDLTLTFSSEYNANARSKLNSLRIAASNRQASILYIAGASYGNWVITKITWKALETMGTGEPIRISARVSFKQDG